MGANDVEGRGQPIPKLLEQLVFAHVVPRLPWYTRPVCRTLSKSWRTMMDTRNLELDLRTRAIQVPLLRGLFLFCTFDKQIFISDPEIKGACCMNGYQVQPRWRKLPPLPSFAPPPIRATIVASSGMVYVWPEYGWVDEKDGEEQIFVYKLDIGRADFTWKRCWVPCAFNAGGVAFNGTIYVRRFTNEPAVLVHDMATDTCNLVEKWWSDDLRVLWRSTDSGVLVEEMYGFVQEDSPPTKVEVVMYDAGSDCWRTWEEVPLPKYRYSHLEPVKLLNAECFEPVLETGTNLVWLDYDNAVISWFNSSVGNSWVHIDATISFQGMCLDNIEFIRDSMYGIFVELKDDVEGGKEGSAGLFKRVLMKGRINVASKSVAWEEIEKAEAKLDNLKQGIVFVNADEREKVQEAFVAKLSEWRKRKKMFKELWDLITESLPKDLKEFKVQIS